jgi:lipopolysaccharide export system protein LptC
MTDDARSERGAKRRWARPGGAHDWLMKLLKVVLPAAVGGLIAYLLISPLSKEKEISFLLDKNKVDVAGERLKVEAAEYRGLDNQGRAFSLKADRAVQPTSAEEVVDITGMAARIQLDEGPGSLVAERGRYDIEKQKVDVLGPILFNAADGYRLETSDVRIDLVEQKMVSGGRVSGRMPLGRFEANRMEVDLRGRNVVLTGRVRLHIDQGALR